MALHTIDKVHYALEMKHCQCTSNNHCKWTDIVQGKFACHHNIRCITSCSKLYSFVKGFDFNKLEKISIRVQH